jgi:hypothetical protein
MREFPRCPRCSKAILLPLSDYGADHGGSVMYKAWVCADSRCGWTLRIDRGQATYTITRANKTD